LNSYVLLPRTKGNPSALRWSQRVFNFWLAFVLPSGQVLDHEDTHGNVSPWKFSYNQGIMIHSAAALYQATGNATYCRIGSTIADVCFGPGEWGFGVRGVF
jgi:hypothetical protein